MIHDLRTTIYLVRHGHVHNPENIFYGRLPGFRLSETGREEATKLGKHLGTKKLAAIYASPLERTKETATFIQTHHPHLSITPDKRLIEVYSPLEGRSFAELAPTNWNWFLPEYIARGGETMEAIWDRMHHFLQEAATKHHGEEIAVVSHGDPIMITKVMASGKPLRFESIRGEGYVETATGIELRFENGVCRAILGIHNG